MHERRIASTAVGYEIQFAPGFVRALLRSEARIGSSAIILDEGFGRASGLDVAGLAQLLGSPVIGIRGGERAKSWSTLERLLIWMDEAELLRRTQPVVIVGGGAVLDVGSLAASLHRRGVAFHRVPTTPLAMMDAAIGLKTSINFRGHKNSVGTFARPGRVTIDPEPASTVSERFARSAVAEAIKAGIARDHSLLSLLRSEGYALVANRFQDEAGHRLLWGTAKAMSSLVGEDPHEANRVNPGDLGHSFSRRFEDVIRPRLSHGEAVSIDIALSMTLSYTQGLVSRSTWETIIALIRQFQLPCDHVAIDDDLILSAADSIALHRDGAWEFPLLTDSGDETRVHTQVVDRRDIRKMLRAHRSL